MAQCDICNIDDESVSLKHLEHFGIEETDDYFHNFYEMTFCKQCYSRRWELLHKQKREELI